MTKELNFPTLIDVTNSIQFKLARFKFARKAHLPRRADRNTSTNARNLCRLETHCHAKALSSFLVARQAGAPARLRREKVDKFGSESCLLQSRSCVSP